MSDIVRRDNQKPVPVKARRVSAGDPPLSATLRVPPAPPEVAPQTVVYVTLPAGQPQQPPAEVHYHTTVTNHHYAPVRRRRQRTTSFLATFAFVIGLTACAAAFVPQLLPAARYGSIGAAGLAAVALLGAVIVRRTGTGMPLLAVVAAGLGYGLWLKNAGHLPAAWQQVQAASPVPLPTLPPEVGAAAASPAPVAVPPPTSPRPTASAKPKPDNLFDMSDAGPASTDGGAPPATTPAAAPPAVDRAALAATLEQARVAAAARLNVDYAAATTAAKSAAAAYETAKATYPLGAPELAAASQGRIDAYGRLNVVLDQLRADPAVAAAERAVRSAGR